LTFRSAAFLALVAVALALPAGALAWGGTYTAASTGEPVQIQVSSIYPVDPALPQKWADFLATLVHGPELTKLTLDLVPAQVVGLQCGRGALACYSPELEEIIASPDDVPGGPTAQQVITHEYGHHVAANRINPPWIAEDWGTKRWASYENICKRAAAGELHPGNEGIDYETNPGEAFAESYRVLNEIKATGSSSLWNIVNTSFYPDATALALLQQDVTSPWEGNTASTLTGSFGGGTQRTFTLETPIDGTLVARLHAPAKTTFRMSLRAGAKTLATGGNVRYSICGERKLTLRVDRIRGKGAFSISLSKP
jgi:hypothetical protein